MKYKEEGPPLVIIAGKEYGTGSSRDWAAKGTYLLGVKAVIAESFERIRRSNASPLGICGNETFETIGLSNTIRPGQTIRVKVIRVDGSSFEFVVVIRLDS
jgi:aconitate hydratase